MDEGSETFGEVLVPGWCLHRWWEAPGVQAGAHLSRDITREWGGCKCPSRRVHCPSGPGPWTLS